MQSHLETRFAPILEPADPASLPDAPFASPTAYVPLRPDRRGRAVGRRWLREAAETRRLVGHTCIADSTLRRLERLDPYGLRLAADVGAAALVTPDVPLYGFMTAAQRERTRDRHLHRLLRTVDAAPRRGLAPVPLVKALDIEACDEQLRLVAEIGLPEVAFYAREFLLEHDTDLLRRFVRGALRLGLRPTLLGAASPRATSWGPVQLAGRHPYVLARRGVVLDARGRRSRLAHARYSLHARRFLVPGDRGALCTHNHLATRRRIEDGRPTRLVGA